MFGSNQHRRAPSHQANSPRYLFHTLFGSSRHHTANLLYLEHLKESSRSYWTPSRLGLKLILFYASPIPSIKNKKEKETRAISFAVMNWRPNIYGRWSTRGRRRRWCSKSRWIHHARALLPPSTTSSLPQTRKWAPQRQKLWCKTDKQWLLSAW